jgi:competence protein ComEA
MMMFEHQIRGIIAVSIILAIISLIVFFAQTQIHSKSPALSVSSPEKIIVEVAAQNNESGIYFVAPGTSVNQIFSQLAINRILPEDIKLASGMKINVLPEEDHRGVVIDSMDAAKRLALGMPMDVNLANFEELTLIPGVGEVMSANIIAHREKIGRFEKLDQLMDVKGIKEKTMSKLRPYLYVDKLAL